MSAQVFCEPFSGHAWSLSNSPCICSVFNVLFFSAWLPKEEKSKKWRGGKMGTDRLSPREISSAEGKGLATMKGGCNKNGCLPLCPLWTEAVISYQYLKDGVLLIPHRWNSGGYEKAAPGTQVQWSTGCYCAESWNWLKQTNLRIHIFWKLQVFIWLQTSKIVT